MVGENCRFRRDRRVRFGIQRPHVDQRHQA
ncbi:hypothetical protein M2303_006135, partial [Micromonospora sp. H404/HB375]|nr:hypothetical protein [Micromonospora sp. H404/HB375]